MADSVVILLDKSARQEPKVKTRSELPGPPVPKNSVSIWSVLKSVIGKDLSRITLPIGLNEPISFLQRLAEYMEYQEILVKAAMSQDPVERIELVAAFSASTLSNVRLTKPFNPLLYETYELNKPELGFRFIAEQVSHHPPISAFHASSDYYEFSGTIAPKVKFWGRSVDCDPGASFLLKLNTRTGVEVYTWNAANCTIYNIVMGTMYICLNGAMSISSHSTPYEVTLNFKGAGRKGAELLVEGDVWYSKTKIKKIYGNWTHFLASFHHGTFTEYGASYEKEFRKLCDSQSEDCPILYFKNSTILWTAHKRPSKFDHFYNFSYFTLQLNELTATPPLVVTDCRNRPDLRLFENGDLANAAAEKERLEEKQRAHRKKNKKKAVPKWFRYIGKDGYGRSGQYEFENTYWNGGASSDEDSDIF